MKQLKKFLITKLVEKSRTANKVLIALASEELVQARKQIEFLKEYIEDANHTHLLHQITNKEDTTLKAMMQVGKIILKKDIPDFAYKQIEESLSEKGFRLIPYDSYEEEDVFLIAEKPKEDW